MNPEIKLKVIHRNSLLHPYKDITVRRRGEASHRWSEERNRAKESYKRNWIAASLTSNLQSRNKNKKRILSTSTSRFSYSIPYARRKCMKNYQQWGVVKYMFDSIIKVVNIVLIFILLRSWFMKIYITSCIAGWGWRDVPPPPSVSPLSLIRLIKYNNFSYNL